MSQDTELGASIEELTDTINSDDEQAEPEPQAEVDPDADTVNDRHADPELVEDIADHAEPAIARLGDGTHVEVWVTPDGENQLTRDVRLWVPGVRVFDTAFPERRVQERSMWVEASEWKSDGTVTVNDTLFSDDRYTVYGPAMEDIEDIAIDG